MKKAFQKLSPISAISPGSSGMVLYHQRRGECAAASVVWLGRRSLTKASVSESLSICILLWLSPSESIFQYWMRVILIGMSRISNSIFGTIFSLNLSDVHDFFAKYRTGDIMARATNI